MAYLIFYWSELDAADGQAGVDSQVIHQFYYER
jgi:hypothetical protein